jgi:hypothetical protein
MGDNGLQDLLEKRCRRSIAVILGVKEREVDEYLPKDAQMKLRKVVMDQLNDFCALATDILESTSDGVVLNDIWLQKIDEVHRAVVK